MVSVNVSCHKGLFFVAEVLPSMLYRYYCGVGFGSAGCAITVVCIAFKELSVATAEMHGKDGSLLVAWHDLYHSGYVLFFMVCCVDVLLFC